MTPLGKDDLMAYALCFLILFVPGSAVGGGGGGEVIMCYLSVFILMLSV
jgi:hypothetical protein